MQIKCQMYALFSGTPINPAFAISRSMTTVVSHSVTRQPTVPSRRRQEAPTALSAASTATSTPMATSGSSPTSPATPATPTSPTKKKTMNLPLPTPLKGMTPNPITPDDQ